MSNLLTFDQALGVIRDNVNPLGRTRRIELLRAQRFVLAEFVLAPEPNPRFDNSAVDGYAVGSATDSGAGSKLGIQGAVAAGEARGDVIAQGHAIRILTGAPVPDGAYGVAMQEEVDVVEGAITLRDKVGAGDHIRRKGCEFEAGFQLAAPGRAIDAGLATVLAYAGLTQPLVHESPLITILTTGDELVDASVTPNGSQIRDTNSVMLRYQVQSATPAFPSVVRVLDSREALALELDRAAAESDLVIISGGASVGDRDYVAQTVAELGTVYFHGVAIRPGKPTLFGRVHDSYVFGLPGNAASAFVCFELFVRTTIRRLAGWVQPESEWDQVMSGVAHRAIGREDFLRVHVEAGSARVYEEQGSFGITSLARSGAIARFPAGLDVSVGEPIDVLRLR